MPTFLLSYRVPLNYEGTPEIREAWTGWFESMGESVLDRGNPPVQNRTLGNCPTDTRQGGYSMLEAPDIDAAVAAAEHCPGLLHGFGVEIAELMTLHNADA